MNIQHTNPNHNPNPKVDEAAILGGRSLLAGGQD